MRCYETSGLMSRCQRGASLLEVMLVLALLLIFIVVASQRILQLREVAEQVGVEQTIGALRSALGVHMAVTVVQQGMDGLRALDATNPVDLLEQAPVNYLGVSAVGIDPHPPGSWYFNSQQRELIYRVRYPERLYSPDSPDTDRIRLRLQVHYGPETLEGEVRAIQRIGIEPVYAYRWLEE